MAKEAVFRDCNASTLKVHSTSVACQSQFIRGSRKYYPAKENSCIMSSYMRFVRMTHHQIVQTHLNICKRTSSCCDYVDYTLQKHTQQPFMFTNRARHLLTD